ncbi:hypothetical protein CPB86DRAFT_171952 [Serendipita vermifera]|nr:hypothetical protein CPB86DRAFT_171952 [Serendipita vermifera]
MSYNAPITSNNIELFARRQLSIYPPNPIPSHYLAELHQFAMEFPYDGNFTISMSTPYGTVVCWEKGCDGLQIPMPRSFRIPASRSGDIGSLDSYKTHIRSHPTHASSRTQRVRAGQFGNAAPIQYPRPNESFAPIQIAHTMPNPARPVPSTSNPMIRKRFNNIECIELSSDSDSDSNPPNSKRPKLETTLPPKSAPRGTSLAQVRTISANIPSTSSQASMLPPPVMPQNRFSQVGQQSQGGIQTPCVSNLPYQTAFLNQSQPALSATSLAINKPRDALLKTNGVSNNMGLVLPQLNRLVDVNGSRALSTSAPSIGKWPAFGTSISATQFQPPFYSDSAEETFQEEYLSSDGDLIELGATHAKTSILSTSVPNKVAADSFHSFVEGCHKEAFGGNITVQEALRHLSLPEFGAVLPGMQIQLLAHQVLGVSWMKRREEEGARHARGGILADAMGLGKTIQTIGVICANPSNDPKCRSTLIIAPLALLEQWRAEIAMKTEEDMLKILIYHGPNRSKNKKEIEKYDVVLTTYHTLANDWPDEDDQLKKRRKNKKNKGRVSLGNGEADDTESEPEKKRREYGPLMEINWYRVVLDEAQNIKNRQTRASRVVTHLIADIRWCLTGTPVINGLNDIFPQLRFIQHRPFGDWERFRALVNRKEDAAKRVQQAIAGVIYRRTKDFMLDGKKVIELPLRTEDWVVLDFEAEERAIYDFVEKKAQAVFNKFLQAGTVLKNYSQVLVMLLRLRQICVHPCLLKAEEDAFEVKDTRSAGAKQVLEEAARLVSNEYVAIVKQKLRENALERMKTEKLKGGDATVEDNCTICLEPFGEDAVITPCIHTFCRGCIEAHINKPRTEQDSRFQDHERDCPLCRQLISLNLLFERAAFEPTDEELEVSDTITDSFDISWEVDSTGQGRYTAKTNGKKRRKRKAVVDTFSDLEDFIVDDDVVDGEASYKPKRRSKAKRNVTRSDIRSSQSSEEICLVDETDGISTAHSESDDDLKEFDLFKNTHSKDKGKRKVVKPIIIDSDAESTSGDQPLIAENSKSKGQDQILKEPEMISSFLPSTKMKYMMSQLQSWAKSHPDDKTMVVSQWTSALDLCSDYLKEFGICHVFFKGSMNVRERNEAISAFMTKPSVTVMLMSLKCGGVGLNLTRGNRVISLDLGWSNAVDQQAFDRVHRLGQQKEVVIQRTIIRNTVEQRVREIQERKQSLSDGALGEGSGRRVRLSVAELASLFGIRLPSGGN